MTRKRSVAAVWSLVVVALLPAVVAVLQLGRIHPDEVYQALEPAYWRVHGYGVLAWEWRDGIRNWAVPGVLAGFLKLASWLGITDPQGYRALTALPQLALHAWSLWAVFRFAARRAGSAGGWLAVMLVGLYGPVVVFAGRTLSESFSTSFLLVAMEALDRREREVRAGLLGGAALGLAVVTRYPSAIFVLAALLWLLAMRRWRMVLFTCLGGLVVAAGLGLLDHLTWGSPFHSFIAYVRFNVLSGDAAARFGADPPRFYLKPLLSAVPVWAWGAVPLALIAAKRKWEWEVSLPLTCATLYLAALLKTPHKEERFLYPALVLAVLAAAPVVAAFITTRARREFRWGLSAVALGVGAASAVYFPPFDLRGDEFRAIVASTRREGATGVLIVAEGLWGAGGFFYLGKEIPWLTCDWPRDEAFQVAMRERRFNRVVTIDDRTLPELEAAGFRTVERFGRQSLLVRD
ncbi:glycosyltransferase family 39 protein [Myxococcus landrumensis]|uniref:glycosyltransferase family 39 protein n=1 Tax=Myxococcus landrumensis TaxID=2813577 RepID=UPI001F50DE5D|nr:glycosyltransferase family 39 protein [Myxococcus landrumus]